MSHSQQKERDDQAEVRDDYPEYFLVTGTSVSGETNCQTGFIFTSWIWVKRGILES